MNLDGHSEKRRYKTWHKFALMSVVLIGTAAWLAAQPAPKPHSQEGQQPPPHVQEAQPAPHFQAPPMARRPGPAFAEPGRPMPPLQARGGRGQLAGLNLTDDQREALREIRKAVQEERAKLIKKLQNARRELNKAANAKEFDEDLIREKAMALAKAEAQMAILRAKTLAKLRHHLQPEQLRQLKGMIDLRAGGPPGRPEVRQPLPGGALRQMRPGQPGGPLRKQDLPPARQMPQRPHNRGPVEW